MSKGNLNIVLRITLVAIVYFIAARFGLMLELGNTNASPVWPPSGIAFAAILILGIETWPGITLGALAVNLLVFYENKATGTSSIIISSALICVGNTLEAVTGYYLLKKFNATSIISRAKDFALFVATALLMCIVSATIGTLAITVNKIITWHAYGSVWFTWWMGDISGIIVLTPVLLSWGYTHKFEKLDKWQILQIVLLFLVLGTYMSAVFADLLPLGLNKAKIFFIFFILIWCAFRMNQWQSSLVVLFLSTFSIWSTLINHGPFIESTQNESLLSLQVFLCIASVTMMFLSTTLQERRRTEINLKEANATLEEKVLERTHHIEEQKEKTAEANKQLIRKTMELERASNDSLFFSHLISHDLREPLRTITSFLQLLEERYKHKLDKEADDYIEYAVNGAKRMDALIEDMLIYSRLEHRGEELKEVAIADVITIIKDNLRNTITTTQANLIIGENMPVIYADFYQMVQLFQNLVDNAIKYRSSKIPEIKITSKKVDNTWLFSVEDNGIGIPRKHLERVFVIFQRLHTRDKYEGTGVGLAICKKIVERYGGKIWAESNDTEGTVFYFTLPASVSPVA